MIILISLVAIVRQKPRPNRRQLFSLYSFEIVILLLWIKLRFCAGCSQKNALAFMLNLVLEIIGINIFSNAV